MGEGVDIIYVDEQEAVLDGRAFTAVVAANLPVESINSFRREFFYWLHEKLFPQLEENARTIRSNDFPLLHGREFMPDYADDVKIEVMEKFVSAFHAKHGRFSRLGYYNDTLKFLESVDNGQKLRELRISFCLSNLLLTRGPKLSRDFIIASEIDIESLRRSQRTIDDQIASYYLLDGDGSGSSISIDYQRFIGHFFLPKSNIGCQLADIGGHIALKAQAANSEYSRAVGSLYSKHPDLYDFDEIIALNIQ